ncbi:MAG TPA: MBL fold metallo-hydrolase [Chloroflexota bacterium]
MKVTFWGVRGSIATPGRATVEYGGNTSCVELQAGSERLILDCGTGIRELGRQLLSAAKPINTHILLSHSHWDHIQGFPFFGPAFVPGNEITIIGPHEHTYRLNETMAGQMQYRYFPIGLEQLSADIRYHEVREEKFAIGPVAVSTHYLNHTIMAVAYRFDAFGRSVVYATDNEPFSQQGRAWVSPDDRRFIHRRDEELAAFTQGADVLIMDSQYTEHEYPQKVGWGHATPDYALEVAASAGVGTLVLFHHDPTRVDTAVSVLEQLAQKRAQQECPGLEIVAASEGLSLELDDEQTAAEPPTERSMPQFHARVRIAVAGAREEFMGIAWKALAQDHYEVAPMEAPHSDNGGEVNDFAPHLVLLEYTPERWDSNLGAFIEDQRRRNVPVISVVPDGQFALAQDAFEHGASDVLIEPFAPTQLRSRVDSWLMRSGVAVDRRVRGRSDS